MSLYCSQSRNRSNYLPVSWLPPTPPPRHKPYSIKAGSQFLQIDSAGSWEHSHTRLLDDPYSHTNLNNNRALKNPFLEANIFHKIQLKSDQHDNRQVEGSHWRNSGETLIQKHQTNHKTHKFPTKIPQTNSFPSKPSQISFQQQQKSQTPPLSLALNYINYYKDDLTTLGYPQSKYIHNRSHYNEHPRRTSSMMIEQSSIKEREDDGPYIVFEGRKFYLRNVL